MSHMSSKTVNLQIHVHVKVAQEQSKPLVSNVFGTPQRKGGGPFHVNQVVRNRDTGYLATVLGFPGQGRCIVRSQYSNKVYTKNYRYLEAVC